MKWLIKFFVFLLCNSYLSAQKLNWVKVTEGEIWYTSADLAILDDSSIIFFSGWVDTTFNHNPGGGEVIDVASFVQYDKSGNYLRHLPYNEVFTNIEGEIYFIEKCKTERFNDSLAICTFVISHFVNGEMIQTQAFLALNRNLQLVWKHYYPFGGMDWLDLEHIDFRGYFVKSPIGENYYFNRSNYNAFQFTNEGIVEQWFSQIMLDSTHIQNQKVYQNSKSLYLLGLVHGLGFYFTNGIRILNLALKEDEYIPVSITPLIYKLVMVEYEIETLSYKRHIEIKLHNNEHITGFGDEGGVCLDTLDNIYIKTSINGSNGALGYSISVPSDTGNVFFIESQNIRSNLILKFSPEGQLVNWIKYNSAFDYNDVAAKSMIYVDSQQVVQLIGTGPNTLDYNFDEEHSSIMPSSFSSNKCLVMSSYDTDFNYLGHTLVQPLQPTQSFNECRLINYVTDLRGNTIILGSIYGIWNLQLDTMLSPIPKTGSGNYEKEFIASYSCQYAKLSKPLSPAGFCNGDTMVILNVQTDRPELDFVWQVNDGSGFKNIYDSIAYSGLHSPELSILNPQEHSGHIYRCWTGSGSCWINAGEAGIFNQSSASSAFIADTSGIPSVSINANIEGPFQNTWLMGDGSEYTNTESFTHTYNTNGTYTITHILQTNCGNDTSTSTISIKNVGLQRLELMENFRLFPNPAKESLSYESTFVIETIVITDMLGKEVLHINNPSKTIDISSLNKGQYIVQAFSEEQRQIGRFVKE